MCSQEKDDSYEKLGKEEEERGGGCFENPFVPAFQEDERQCT